MKVLFALAALVAVACAVPTYVPTGYNSVHQQPIGSQGKPIQLFVLTGI